MSERNQPHDSPARALVQLRHIAVLVVPSAYFLAVVTQYRWYFIALALLCSISVVCDWRRPAPWHRLRPLFLPLLVFLLSLGISATWALDTNATFQGMILPTVYLLLFICTARWSQEQPLIRQTTLFVVLVWVVAATFVYIYARFGTLKPVHEDIAEVFGAGSNAGAMHVLVALPFIVWRIRFRKSAFDWLTLAVAIAVLTSSATRAAYVIAPIILLASFGRPGARRVRRFVPLLSGAIAVAIVIWLTTLTPIGRSAMDRLGQTFSGLSDPTTLIDPDQGDYKRAVTYIEGWGAFQTRPLTGIGYKNLEGWVESRYGWGQGSHNLLVTLLAEAGWPATFAFAFLLYRFFLVLRNGISIDPRGVAAEFYSTLILAMLAALMFSMFHQLLDFQLFYVLLGMCLATPMLPRGLRLIARSGHPVRVTPSEVLLR